ncbi:reverse transcriptase family protein [Yoonia maritima]|uniref:reverse transcriptase family protein n=1 Tax=Yoonia maritima TaxID=1435347 RepID=UPI000D0EF347|nr:reverse transcriptase family protein [Yoonia maritima]
MPELTGALQRRLPPQFHREAQLIAADLIPLLPVMVAPTDGAITKGLLNCGAFARLHRECLRLGIWPAADLQSDQMRPYAPFAQLDLPDLRTEANLADWLMLDYSRVAYFTDISNRQNDHPDAPVHHYLYGLRRKSSGGLRVIEAPKSNLKSIQRRILHGILDQVPVHTDAFGFVRGRSCVQGAARHCGEECVVRFDLRDFFPSIQSKRVLGLFRRLGYPRWVAQSLTGLCTTATPGRVLVGLPPQQRQQMRVPHLPQGAATSPALANLIAFTLDRRLSGLARSVGAGYSRYADDLTFSGDIGITGVLEDAIPQIIADEGFVINPNKTRVTHRSERQTVTGIVVNQHLNISRKQYDQIKAIIHALRRPDDPRRLDQAFCLSLEGKIDWVCAVNPHRGNKLRRLYQVTIEDFG